MRADLEVTIPGREDVTVTVEGRTVTAKGKKGEIKHTLKSGKITVTLEDGNLKLSCKAGTKREKVAIYTAASHLKNLIQGAAEGYEYKLKICSGHFPMTVAVQNGTLTVKNFIGESVPRTLKLKEGADVKVDGDIITVQATSKEVAGQCAADIEKLCRRPAFDNRIFQDGIYIISKAGKEIV